MQTSRRRHLRYANEQSTPHFWLCKKANNTLAFLRRNIGTCPQSAKERAFTTFVRPTIEYAAAVWDPPTQRNINALERVQRKGAIFVMNNYRKTSSVTSMMSQLGWEELRLRRARIKTILLFKIVNNLVDIPPEPFLIPTGAITRGHSIRFLQPHTRTITMQYSFFPSAIRTWNTLPQQLASMTSPWRVSDRPWPTPPLYHRTTPSVFNCIYWTF